MFRALLARSRAAVLIEEPFLPLPERQFAYTAARRGLAGPRGRHGPGLLTCLVGETGAGKSCLVRQALRCGARSQPPRPFAWQSATEWLPLLRQAQQQGRMIELLEQAAKLALLVADDLDRGVTDETSAELWATFSDELLARGVSVLITLSQPPGRCPGFTPRLVNRLHGGLYALLPPLEAASRQRLVRFLTDRHQLPLEDDAVAWLADQPPGTPRSLSLAVERLAQHPTATTRTQVQQVLTRLVSHSQRPQLTVIAQLVAEEFGLTAADLRSSSRQRSLHLPRQCAMFLAHDLADCPMEDIGRFFGRRTHSSVSLCCRKLQELLPGSPTLREQLQRLRQRIVNSLREDCA